MAAAAEEVAQAPSRRYLAPKTQNQEKYIRLLQSKQIVFAQGPSGSGKTAIAVSEAVKALTDGKIGRIILTRPVVESQENLGFLPGNVDEKIDPYMVPLFDELKKIVPPDEIKIWKAKEKDMLRVIPLAYTRGLNFHNSFIILDEAQNCTLGQIKLFMTRLGEHSKMVITGDCTQTDLHIREAGGFQECVTWFGDESINEIGVVSFQDTDIVRNPLITKILRTFAKMESAVPEQAPKGGWKEYYR